jgi:hypothetical protein
MSTVFRQPRLARMERGSRPARERHRVSGASAADCSRLIVRLEMGSPRIELGRGGHWRDLPGNAPLVFAPAARAFLPAIANDGVPVAVGLVLIVGGDLEREGRWITDAIACVCHFTRFTRANGAYSLRAGKGRATHVDWCAREPAAASSRRPRCKKGRGKLAPPRDATRSHAPQATVGCCPYSGSEA